MRALLSLQTRSISTTAYGAGDETWISVTNLRGFIQSAGGSSRLIGEAVQDESLRTITIRYDGQITPLMRLTEPETGRVFQIIEAGNEDDRDHTIVLNCREMPI